MRPVLSERPCTSLLLISRKRAPKENEREDESKKRTLLQIASHELSRSPACPFPFAISSHSLDSNRPRARGLKISYIPFCDSRDLTRRRARLARHHLRRNLGSHAAPLKSRSNFGSGSLLFTSFQTAVLGTVPKSVCSAQSFFPRP